MTTTTVKYAIAVDITTDDGQHHRVGTTHREAHWRCYTHDSRKCPAIDTARAAVTNLEGNPT